MKSVASKLKKCGKNYYFGRFHRLKGAEFISMGDNVVFDDSVVLTVWEHLNNRHFSPSVVIGNNVSISDFCHISIVNALHIDSGTAIGKWVTISDNSHGNVSYDDMQLGVFEREIVSRGSINIGRNVWVGDKVTILAPVSIGDGAIITANAVVTKDVPPYCVVAGAPARVIKDLRPDSQN